MKRLSITLSTLLILALFTAVPTFAQHEQHHEQERSQTARTDTMPGMMRMMQGGMMGPNMMRTMHGMHQRMMQNPMHRSSMMAFLLPALADTLGLSEEQTSRLDELKSELTSQLQSNREQMRTRRQELMRLFEEGEQPAAAEVRRHLEAMAQMRVDGQALLYETAEQMREVLTGEQRQMLTDMTPQERMHHMMSGMTMMDMMQMMRSMRGGMIDGGMMDMMQAE